jgi:hypothetical protein
MSMSVVTICRMVMIVLRVCICESAEPPGSGIRPQCGKTFFELNVTLRLLGIAGLQVGSVDFDQPLRNR